MASAPVGRRLPDPSGAAAAMHEHERILPRIRGNLVLDVHLVRSEGIALVDVAGLLRRVVDAFCLHRPTGDEKAALVGERDHFVIRRSCDNRSL